MTNPKIAILRTLNSDPITLKWLQDQSSWDVVTEQQGFDFVLPVVENRVQLLKVGEGAPGPLELDFLSDEWRFRAKTLSKNQLLFKAIGFKQGAPSVWDATAGLGRDAYCCVLMGCQVHAIEENLAVYFLLKNAVDRLDDSKRQRFTVSYGDSLEQLANLKESKAPDVIYLDPMYDFLRTKSKPKKELFILRHLIAKQQNLPDLLHISVKKARRHVVLKQPLKSPEIYPPQHSFRGKMVRYDRFVK